ncbi:MAG: response regulator, partial [candidate division NC10 bacterium]
MANNGKRVLIVDDDRQVREVLHEIFLSHGYTCELANDGREGLAVFRATRPPLTVTDVKMPIMDGLEFLKSIRELDTDAAVIVLTGVGDV